MKVRAEGTSQTAVSWTPVWSSRRHRLNEIWLTVSERIRNSVDDGGSLKNSITVSFHCSVCWLSLDSGSIVTANGLLYGFLYNGEYRADAALTGKKSV